MQPLSLGKRKLLFYCFQANRLQFNRFGYFAKEVKHE